MRLRTLFLSSLFLVVGLSVAAASQVAATIPAPADSLNAIIAAGTAFVSVATLGALKSWTGAADSWIGQKIKPVQPWLVTALSLVMPAVIHGTPNVPDAGTLVAAPTATLLAVGQIGRAHV